MVTYLIIYEQDTALVGKRMIIYACGYISSSYHYIYVYDIFLTFFQFYLPTHHLFSVLPTHTPSIIQFVWTDYSQAFMLFYCYNITGDICYNYGACLFSRDTRRLGIKIMQKVHQLHDNRTLCVNKRRAYQITHTIGTLTIKSNIWVLKKD